MARRRTIYSERVDLIEKAREAMLAAVQLYNNPLVSFKTESFIVLSQIAWTYLLHAYFREKKIEYRYFRLVNKRRKFVRNSDGSIRYWDLNECITKDVCPLDKKPNPKELRRLHNNISLSCISKCLAGSRVVLLQLT